MCSDSEKNMSAFADQNHAPSLTCVRLEKAANNKFVLVIITFIKIRRKEEKGMKKAEGYVIRKLAEEYVLIPCGERAEEMNETISLSETAGFIYINADKADSTEELAGLVAEEYDVPKSEVLEDVKAVVKTLQQKGILL